MKEMLSSLMVEEKDVLVCYKPHLKQRDCYFVVGINAASYDVFRLETQDFLHYQVGKRDRVSKSRYICYLNKLNEEQIEDINKQIEKLEPQYTLKKHRK